MNKRFQVVCGLLGFKTLEDFSVGLGLHPTYLSQVIKKGINPRFAKRLTEKFPRVNLVYLEKGEGEPLLPEGAFDVSDIQRAGKVQMVVDLLQRLDPENLKIIMEGIEKFRGTSHFIRFTEADSENRKPKKK